MKKFSLILIVSVLAVLMLSSCSGKNKDTSASDSGSIYSDASYADIKPQDSDKIMSDISNYTPESGYNFKTSESTVSEGDTYYELTDETSSKELGCVYITSGSSNTVEIDIYTKECTDSDLAAGLDMAYNAIQSIFSDYTFEKYPEIPLDYDSVKAVINNNASQSNSIYSEGLSASVSYEYFPSDGLLNYYIEYKY